MKNFRYYFFLMAAILMSACGESESDDIVPEDDRELSYSEGFKKDFPEASNVSWKVIGDYNFATFYLPTKGSKSEGNSYKAEAYYPNNNINFLTQEYIPISMVPQDCIDKVKAKLEIDHNETVICIDAIKATCNGTIVYKVLFERPETGSENPIQPCYIYCNGKLVDFWEYSGSELEPIEMPAMELMTYVEANYDNYCLTLSSFDEDEYEPFGTYLPIYFTEKAYASELFFHDYKTNEVTEYHYYVFPAIDIESNTMPSTLPQEVQSALKEYINKHLQSTIGDDWVFGNFDEEVIKGISTFELQIFYNNGQDIVTLSIDENNVVTESEW